MSWQPVMAVDRHGRRRAVAEVLVAERVVEVRVRVDQRLHPGWREPRQVGGKLGAFGRGRPAVHHDEMVAIADDANVDRERFVRTNEYISGDLDPLKPLTHSHVRSTARDQTPHGVPRLACERVLGPSD
jgi:hypothetical protein